MAKAKTHSKSADGNQVVARALVSIPGQDINAGEFFSAPDHIVAALADDGAVDPRAAEADVYGSDIPPRKVWRDA